MLGAGLRPRAAGPLGPRRPEGRVAALLPLAALPVLAFALARLALLPLAEASGVSASTLANSTFLFYPLLVGLIALNALAQDRDAGTLEWVVLSAVGLPRVQLARILGVALVAGATELALQAGLVGFKGAAWHAFHLANLITALALAMLVQALLGDRTRSYAALVLCWLAAIEAMVLSPAGGAVPLSSPLVVGELHTAELSAGLILWRLVPVLLVAAALRLLARPQPHVS